MLRSVIAAWIFVWVSLVTKSECLTAPNISTRVLNPSPSPRKKAVSSGWSINSRLSWRSQRKLVSDRARTCYARRSGVLSSRWPWSSRWGTRSCDRWFTWTWWGSSENWTKWGRCCSLVAGAAGLSTRRSLVVCLDFVNLKIFDFPWKGFISRTETLHRQRVP